MRKVAPVVPRQEKPALGIPILPRKGAQVLVFLPGFGWDGFRIGCVWVQRNQCQTSAKAMPEQCQSSAAMHVQGRELCEPSTRQQWRWMRLWENAVRFR